MTLQLAKNVRIAYKIESTFNTPPAVVTGANQFRPNAGPGLSLSRPEVKSNEIRSDLKTTMSRLGSKEVKGSYTGDVSVGTFDPLFQAVMRGAWSAVLTASQTDFTSVTQTANAIVGASGSFITKGLMGGDGVQINVTGGPAANNNRNLRVTSVAAGSLGIAETLVVDATARTTFTITRTKKLIQPTVPIRSSFTFEKYLQDLDLSEQYTGCRISSMKLTGKPNGMVEVEFGIVGADLNPLSSANSPFYTSPTLTSTIALVIADATLRFNGADVANLTSFDLSLDTKAATLPVIGSLVTPDVFDNAAEVSGSLSVTQVDFGNLTAFTAETELSFQALLVEPTSEPKSFVSIFIPRLKLTGDTAPFGQDGASIETVPFTVGDKGAGVTGYDDTMIVIQTSAT